MFPDVVKARLDALDAEYAALHTAKEDAFWTAKMGLDPDRGRSQAELDERDIALSRFLRDPARLRCVRELVEFAGGDDRVRADGWIATFTSHTIEDAEARALAEELTRDEGQLELARGAMPLGYADPDAGFVRASSVKLGTLLQAERSEARRRAAWEGLSSIETYVLEHGLLDIIRKRNRLGRLLGAEDYYDWKTRRVEGMSKAELFALLDELEARTRTAAVESIEAIRRKHGDSGLRPWNIVYLNLGDLTRELDPFFPFGSSIERWGRTFSALGIRYAGAELVLDLLDRPGKFENGFMHGPVVGWRRDGQRIPARIHFTANALPGAIGAGKSGLKTLFHEGGHAAHFANIDMPSPCFGQEFAPTSAAFAETQSMLLDSLLGDADWQRRYARDRSGAPVPVELIARSVAVQQPLAAWTLRSMLSVCYAEKALYELSDSELTPAGVLAALRDVERRFVMLDEGSPRPSLAVPHLISGEFSAYYHSYVLAQMAVAQARAHFIRRDGHLVDNPRVGPELREVWWKPGNSVRFSEFVVRLTGRGLGARDLAERVNRSVEAATGEAEAAVARLFDVPEPAQPVELDARIRVVHGAETVSELAGDFEAFAGEFKRWIDRAP